MTQQNYKPRKNGIKLIVPGIICVVASLFLNVSDNIRTVLFLLGCLALIIGVIMAIVEAVRNRRPIKQAQSFTGDPAQVPVDEKPVEATTSAPINSNESEQHSGNRYLFYDVETPNRRNDSICAVGWVLYEDNRKISQAFQYIDPQAPFDAFNTRLHGVTASNVNDAPTFGKYWTETLEALMTSSVVIAHGAGFDMSVTSKALAAEGIEFPAVKFFDSLPAFRALYPDMSCKLSNLAAKFGYEYQAHHAGDDARILADVMCAACSENGFVDFSEFFDATKVSTLSQKTDPAEQAEERMNGYEKYLTSIQQIIENGKSKKVDLSDIHFGFHGNLEEPLIGRKNGLDKIVEGLGGVFHDNVSGKLDYYVCFDDDETNTVLKARNIASDPRYHLQIIDGQSFLNIIGYGSSEPDHAGPAEVRAQKQRERDEKEAAEREKEIARAQRAARKAEKAAQKEEKQPTQPRGRAVRQLDKDGNLVNQFPSITIAATTVGTNAKSIRDVLAGKQKTAGGFRWQSVVEEDSPQNDK